MGMDWAPCAVREIKRKPMWRQQRLQHCGTGQRHFLPSSVIICMLVPLLLSWLNEITGSFLPGFANGAGRVLRGKQQLQEHVNKGQTKKKKKSKCWQLVITEIFKSVSNYFTGKKSIHATQELAINWQTYLVPLWWEYLLQWWQTSALLIRALGYFLERIYPSLVVWSLNGHII